MSEKLPARIPTATVQIGGKDYAYKTIKNCFTCQSPHRDYIENCLLMGMPYQRIYDSLEDMDPGVTGSHPTVASIGSHYRRDHMPIVSTTQRMLIEERGRNIGLDIQNHAGSLVDYQTLNQIVIQKGMRRIVDGEIEPSMADTLSAIRMQHSIDQSVGDGLDVETMQETMLLFMEIARDFIPPDRMTEYGRALNNHPVLRALINKSAEEGEVIDPEAPID